MKIIKCDICGATNGVQSWRLPVYRMHDGCDGLTRYAKPKIAFRDLDICEDCLSMCTNINDDTVMGHGGIYIQNNPIFSNDN